MDNATVDTPELRFEALKPTASWYQAFFAFLLGGGNEDYRGRMPEVVCVNRRSQRRTIEVLDTYEEAEGFRTSIEVDFHSLSIDVWCDRYGVPPTFIAD